MISIQGLGFQYNQHPLILGDKSFLNKDVFQLYLYKPKFQLYTYLEIYRCVDVKLERPSGEPAAARTHSKRSRQTPPSASSPPTASFTQGRPFFQVHSKISWACAQKSTSQHAYITQLARLANQRYYNHHFNNHQGSHNRHASTVYTNVQGFPRSAAGNYHMNVEVRRCIFILCD